MTTVWNIALGATVALVLSTTSCAEDSDADGDDGTGGPSDDGGELDCTPNDSNGDTQCTNQLCSASQYCDPFDGLCANGCASTLNCAFGDYCDKRMPTESVDGSLEIGICRTPGAECGAGDDSADDAGDDVAEGPDPDSTGAAPSCGDYAGNYEVRLDVDSPVQCNDAFSGTEMCSLVQTGCELDWGCDGNFGVTFPPGPVDEDGVYHGTGDFMGIAFECEITFVSAASYSFSWECSANVGMPILCTGIGV
ncbi:MAG TPA: hypothetical protein VFG69_16055 [Nannocystaceae bacterium]|nr:hypothetical protein [Nannocystaceae bacterium]